MLGHCAPLYTAESPLFTNRFRQNRLRFAYEHRDWTFEEWKRVLWSDESPFELFASTNRQNDRICSRNSDSIQPVIQVEFPANS